MNKTEEDFMFEMGAQFVLAIMMSNIEKLNANAYVPLDIVLDKVNEALKDAKEEVKNNKAYNIISSDSIKVLFKDICVN